ncbi:MAG: MAPEG family protein, partial [Paracoccaceae bacterium]
PYAAFRDPRHDEPTKAPWAQRTIRAHTNAVENLVVFGVLVIVLEISGGNSTFTAGAAKLYFFSRVVHFFVYTFAVPWARTPIYLVGFGCQMAIAWVLLG